MRHRKPRCEPSCGFINHCSNPNVCHLHGLAKCLACLIKGREKSCKFFAKLPILFVHSAGQ